VTGAESSAGVAEQAIESAMPSSPAPQVEPTSGPCDPDPAAGTVARFVYALGQIEPRFASAGIEKEFAQAAGRTDTASLTDREALHAVLSQREHRYLVRGLCWVLTIEGLETYVLTPRDPADFDLLIEALRPRPHPADLDAVIGVRGPLAPPEACGGAMLPMVMFDQIYSFDRDALVKAIPRPKEIAAKEFTSAANEVLARVMQMADNAGATDDHRALNYLVLRYPAIYATAAECYGREFSLTGVDARPSRLAGPRNVVDVVFSFTSRRTDVNEKYFVRVDVTEAFPFLVTKLAPYVDR
jgi:PatG C-terminal